MSRVRSSAIGIACTFAVSSPLAAQPSHWPTIRPAEVTRTYDVSGREPKDTPLLLVVHDTSGKPAYRLECHNGDYDADREYDYSGDFQCALFAVRGRTVTSRNLLATSHPVQASTDWMNRGRMVAWQLSQTCADVPDYGRTRHFRLRHMQLSMQFENLRWRAGRRPLDPVLDGFTIHIHVSPEPAARTATAAPAPLKIDPALCDFPLGG